MTSSLVAPREELAMVLSPFAGLRAQPTPDLQRDESEEVMGGCAGLLSDAASRSFPWSIRRPRVARRSA